MIEAKIFLDKKQNEHFDKHGIYADVNSKIAEWMQEYAEIYHKSEVNKLNKANVIKLVCQYEPDNTTAMNCKRCGQAKWLH